MMVENFVIVMRYHLVVVVVIHLDYWRKNFLYVLVLIPIVVSSYYDY